MSNESLKYIRYSRTGISNKNIDDAEETEMVIPKGVFEQPKIFIMFKIPYCSENELVAKRFLDKFHEFTKNTYDVGMKWVTRKVKSLFSLKDKKTRTLLCHLRGNLQLWGKLHR